METAVVKMLFILSASAHFGKHIYVEKSYTWTDAQQYCRRHYTDLSPITTRRDETRLKNASLGRVNGEFWIGLHRVGTTWKWSGGGNATYLPWGPGEPTNSGWAAAVCWHHCQWSGWFDTSPYSRLNFFCFNLLLVTYERSWEEAMQHCRDQHTDLTSLASETEQLLAVNKVRSSNLTERVWIGLRYLGDRWLWVDGSPLRYMAWPKGRDQDHLCPIYKRCGALTTEGRWENWDCQDRLGFICY